MSEMKIETSTTMPTPNVPYIRSSGVARLKMSKNPTFELLTAMMGP